MQSMRWQVNYEDNPSRDKPSFLSSSYTHTHTHTTVLVTIIGDSKNGLIIDGYTAPLEPPELWW